MENHASMTGWQKLFFSYKELHPFSREELYSTGLPPGNFFFKYIHEQNKLFSLSL